MFGFLKTFAVPGDDPLGSNKPSLNIVADLKPEDDPMRPVFAPLLKDRGDERNAMKSPVTRCLPFGIPLVYARYTSRTGSSTLRA
jgi:hypothetical protein